MSPTFAVVGGGISGLAAAWELSVSSPQASRIVVLEASGRVGGNLRSAQVGGRRVDVGPDAFLARRPEAVKLCEELGISGDLVSPGTGSASVWSRGRLRRIPDGLVLGVPTRLGPLVSSGVVSPFGVARASLDLLVPTRVRPQSTKTEAPVAVATDRSVGDIVGRRLGAEVRDRLTGPLVGGINAGRVETLSARAVFPNLLEMSRAGGSLMRRLRSKAPPVSGRGTPVPVFLAPRAGVATLATTLAEALGERGVEITTDARVDGVERLSEASWDVTTRSERLKADGVVLAVPARVAGSLLRQVDAELAGALSGITTASVVLVTFAFDSAGVHARLDGSGFLVPERDGGIVTAGTFFSSKWPHAAREGETLVRASAGRAGDDRAIALSDDELVEAVMGELSGIVGDLGQPRSAVVARYADAFPQYLVGHADRVEAMEASASALGSIALAGASYRGVGIPACIGTGRSAALRVLSSTGAALRSPGG